MIVAATSTDHQRAAPNGLSLGEKADLTQTMLRDPQIRPSSRAVGIALLGFLNGQSGECFPSYSTLARAACLKRRATINAIRDLEARGWVTVHRVSGGASKQPKGWVTNRFLVHAPEHVDVLGETATPVHGDAPGPGAPACTTPVHEDALPPVHGDAPPPVHRGAPKPMNIKPVNMNPGDISPATPQPRPSKAGPSEAEIDHAFVDWWPRYPKHVDKLGARRRFGSVLKARSATAEQLNAGADLYRRQCEARGTDRRYIKSPEVWLNKGCWTDEPDLIPTSKPLNGKEPANGWSNLNFGSNARSADGADVIDAEYERVD